METNIETYNSYVGVIRTKYESLPEEGRKKVLTKLESLISETFSDRLESGRGESPTGKASFINILGKTFNYKLAKEIRLRQKVSIRELAGICGIKPTAMVKLTFFELGERSPYTLNVRAGTEQNEMYLNWLKERGYKD